MFTQTERSAAVQTGISAAGADGAADADEVAQTADPVPSASAAPIAAAARRIVVLICLTPDFDMRARRVAFPRSTSLYGVRRRHDINGCTKFAANDFCWLDPMMDRATTLLRDRPVALQ
jgi:hypothetical protein